MNQNSSNSHKASSEDPPNAPPRDGGQPTGRKPGGHPREEGKNGGLLSPEEVQHFLKQVPEECERCHAALRAEPGPSDPAPFLHQAAELPELLCQIRERQAHGGASACGLVT